MSANHGPLVAADETLTHQVVDTFASVGNPDPSWTEKVWMIAHARDASLQVVFGLGKYTNRGVFDAAGGVCRGTDQWTVRGSRRLGSDPSAMGVGPLRYEIVEPLRAVRATLQPTEHADIAYEVTWRGAFAPSIEDSWPERSPDGARITHDVLRYHQVGTVEGWVEVEGERTEIDPDAWVSFRDHSWGIRPGVGLPIPGLPRGSRPTRSLVSWFPMILERADGTPYRLFAFFDHRTGPGFEHRRSQAEEEGPDGVHHFTAAAQDFRFADANRRMLGGTLTLIDSDGSTRPLTITPVGDTGFHLGTAGYFGWNGRVIGQYVGDLLVDGEKVEGCDRPDVARQVHQLRDLLVRVDDPVGGGSGYGNLETMAVGAFPDLGLTEANSFL